MRYCPNVPFRPDLIYCYPEIKLNTADVVGLIILAIMLVVPIVLYMKGKAK